MQLRFASLTVVSSRRDFHPQECAHAGRTKEMSRVGGTVWREHGALSFVECVEDDVKPGKLTSFPQAVKLEEGEVCVFSWITYASRAARDAITAKVMQDPRLASFMDPENMPFDGKRMIYGGFEMIVEM